MGICGSVCVGELTGHIKEGNAAVEQLPPVKKPHEHSLTDGRSATVDQPLPVKTPKADSFDSENVKAPAKPVATPMAAQKKKKSSSDESSDSEDEKATKTPAKPVATPKAAATPKPAPKKKDSSSEDSDSEDDKAKKTPAKAATTPKDAPTPKTAPKNEELNANPHEDGRIVLVLIGISGSGKSTVAKQMRILTNTIIAAYRRDQKRIVYSNTVEAMAHVVTHLPPNVELLGELKRAQRQVINSLQKEDGLPFSPNLRQAFISLLNDQYIRHLIRAGRISQLPANAVYWLSSLGRISDPKYVPTDDDILRAHQKTSAALLDTEFKWNGRNFNMRDAGGHRAGNTDWTSALEGASAVIFVTDLSSFDERIDGSTKNSLEESLALFKEICSNKAFKNLSIVLFLNKKDLLEKKLKKVELADFFPEYKGTTNSYSSVVAYIKRRFIRINEEESWGRQVYAHQTCATDTRLIETIFNEDIDAICKKNLANTVLN